MVVVVSAAAVVVVVVVVVFLKECTNLTTIVARLIARVISVRSKSGYHLNWCFIKMSKDNASKSRFQNCSNF